MGENTTLASVSFDVPDGVVLWAHPRTAPAAEVVGFADPWGGYTSIYVQSVSYSGNVVTVKFAFWAGYANAPWNGLRITYDVYGFYPPVKSGNWGVLFDGSGVDTAIANNTPVQICTWRHSVAAGTSGVLTFDTGIPSNQEPPTVFASDSGENGLAGRVYISNNRWYYRLYRTRHQGGSANQGRVRLVGFTPFDGVSADYGLNIYSASQKLIFSSRFPPLMPRRILTNPTPSPSSNLSSRNDLAGDYFSSEELKGKPMIIPRVLGVGKSYFEAIAGCTAIVGNRFTWSWSHGDREVISSGNANGWWGITGGNSGMPMIYGTDYFNDY